jgi:hypothetical protein
MGGRWLHSGLDRLRGAECMHGFLEIEHVHQRPAASEAAAIAKMLRPESAADDGLPRRGARRGSHAHVPDALRHKTFRPLPAEVHAVVPRAVAARLDRAALAALATAAWARALCSR